MYHLIFVVKIKNNMSVCIIGTGLSALTLAKVLVNQKIYVELVSKKKKSNINGNRTLGISENNIENFNKNIINLDKEIWKLKKIEIFSNNLKKEKILNFENKKSYLFSIIQNYKIIELLNKSLSNNKYFKKTSKKNILNLTEKYDLIIVTEFNNSISKKYFSKKITKNYNNIAYSTVIEHENINNNIATQIFTKKGPLAFLPISDSTTSVVYSINYSANNKSENVEKLIHQHNFKYKINKIRKIEMFELNSCNLRSYYNKNILAFGDLLHKVHPLAGQGFNMTLRDIKIFSEIVKSRINLGLPLDSSINYEFEKKLKHKNFIFSNGIDFIYQLFNFERKTKNTILSKSIQSIGKYPKINKLFTEFANKGI